MGSTVLASKPEIAMNTTTLQNINGSIGGLVVVTDGHFAVLPWASEQMPLSSGKPVGAFSDGTYTITSIEGENGFDKTYTLERADDRVLVRREFAGQYFFDHKLAA